MLRLPHVLSTTETRCDPALQARQGAAASVVDSHTGHATPVGRRPPREPGVVAKLSPGSAALLEAPPASKRSRSSAGQSTEGSKGSIESGATSHVPRGSSSTKRRLEASDMRSPPPPPSQNRRSWASAAKAPPRAPPKLGTCAGLSCELCRWCLTPLATAHEHGEDGCSARQKPSLADWTRHAAKQPELCARRTTRTAADSSSAIEVKPRGRRQTDRSAEEQAQYRAAYNTWHTREARRLSAEASAALAEHVALLLQPLAPSSESGEFSDYEKLLLEFSTMLPSKALTYSANLQL